jgi:hypothetical protein
MFGNLAQLEFLTSPRDALVDDYPNWRVYRSEVLYGEATPEYAALLNHHVLQGGMSLGALDELMGRPGVDGMPGGHGGAKGVGGTGAGAGAGAASDFYAARANGASKSRLSLALRPEGDKGRMWGRHCKRDGCTIM